MKKEHYEWTKEWTSLSIANSKKDLEDEGVIVKLPVYAVWMTAYESSFWLKWNGYEAR